MSENDEPHDEEPQDDDPLFDDSETTTFEAKSDSTQPIDQNAPRPDEAQTDPLESIGRYRILHRIGHGSFGHVYLALDEALDRQVAIKVPHSGFAATVQQRKKQVEEARSIAQIQHPGIVSVYDVGTSDDGTPFVVSQFIDGRNLAAVRDEKSMTLPAILLTISRVAEALHAAHRHGIVHRDVKPANILLDQEGNPYVADFGLALHESKTDLDSSFAGSISYMSPEQAQGRSSMVDGRSDVFSLGIVLYELLTRRLPFQANTIPKLLDRIVRQEARPLRQYDDRIPQEVERICLKALAKKPMDRYATARDLAADLAKCVTYHPQPIDVSGVTVPADLEPLIEELAKHTHDTWASERIREGWSWGDQRNDELKLHPDLIPYEALAEGERDYDRKTVLSTILALLAKGYRIDK